MLRHSLVKSRIDVSECIFPNTQTKCYYLYISRTSKYAHDQIVKMQTSRKHGRRWDEPKVQTKYSVLSGNAHFTELHIPTIFSVKRINCLSHSPPLPTSHANLLWLWSQLVRPT